MVVEGRKSLDSFRVLALSFHAFSSLSLSFELVTQNPSNLLRHIEQSQVLRISPHDEVQGMVSDSNQECLQAPRAGPGETGNVWWSTTSGWRSPTVDAGDNRQTTCGPTVGSTTIQIGRVSRLRKGDMTRFRELQASRSSATTRSYLGQSRCCRQSNPRTCVRMLQRSPAGKWRLI